MQGAGRRSAALGKHWAHLFISFLRPAGSPARWIGHSLRVPWAAKKALTAMRTLSVAPNARQLTSSLGAIPRTNRRRLTRATAAHGALPPATCGGGAGGSTAPAAFDGMPGFMQNPVIAQRELMRQFFQASSAEEQLRLVGEAGSRLGLSTRCAQGRWRLGGEHALHGCLACCTGFPLQRMSVGFPRLL